MDLTKDAAAEEARRARASRSTFDSTGSAQALDVGGLLDGESSYDSKCSERTRKKSTLNVMRRARRSSKTAGMEFEADPEYERQLAEHRRLEEEREAKHGRN